MWENVLRLAFRDLMDGDDELYKALQNASLSRDDPCLVISHLS
jgi:hypothetical protein